MKQLIAFVRKEFLHVLRDRKTLLILFGLPVVQILIFGFALTNEVRNARIVIVDHAHDAASMQLMQRIAASGFFRVETLSNGTVDIESAFRRGDINLALIIPSNFDADLKHLGTASVQVTADASDPNRSSTLTTYLSSVIADQQRAMSPGAVLPMRIDTQIRMLYNPQLKGAPNFVPGVMALVLMLVCVMMTSIAIVREKELGTMEILLVSPFRPLLVVVAKVIPYLFLSLVNIGTILLLSVYVLGLPIQGSVLLLVTLSTLFIITCLALGLLVSTVATTQAVAMLMSLMGMLLPALLFSGFMFPIENMPIPLQVVSNIVPAKWYYQIVKAIMIKGLGFNAIWREATILAGMTIVLTLISVRRFRVRLA